MRVWTIVFAALFGGIVGGFVATWLQPNESPPPRRVESAPDFDRFIEEIDRRIDHRLADRTTPEPKRPAGGETVVERTAVAPSALPPPEAPLTRDSVEELRNRPVPANRMEKIDLGGATVADLTRKYLFRGYREILEEFGFPDSTSVKEGTVRFFYKYRAAPNRIRSLSFAFRDGQVVSVTR